MKKPSLEWTLFAVLLVISTGVVTAAFTPIPHLGGDNAGYIALAHGLLTNGTYTDVFDPLGLPHTKYPPVFPALLAFLIALGARSWVTLKLTAAVCTIAAVGLTYWWAERRLGASAAFGVSLILAMSSGMIYYSQWILSDPLFLALTMLALFALGRADGGAPAKRERVPQADGIRAVADGRSYLWLVLGVFATGLAYFTRSAGLPLVLGLLGWLALRQRWKALGAAGVALGVPMFAWWLRGRGGGVAQYSTEFWMVNPYDPASGTIGPLGLIPRALANVVLYVSTHGPAGIVGETSPALLPIGIALTAAGVTGWVLSVRDRVGPAELFFPVYAGLILLWPTVWSGDRFALPLYPLVLVYGAVALRALVPRFGAGLVRAASIAVILGLVLPATNNWLNYSRQSQGCRAIASQAGPWGCDGPRVRNYLTAATWTSVGLPADAVVLTRKPRLFYLQSGRRSRAFPFVEDPAALLQLADALGARYVLLDSWDALAMRHVGGAVTRQPGAFCHVLGFGRPGEDDAQLLGILPPQDRLPPGATREDGDILIDWCPEGYRSDAAPESYSPSGRIPLLEELGS